MRYSHTEPLRRELWQACLGQGQRTEAVHEWQAEGQGSGHEGHQDGAYSQEGPEQGEALDDKQCDGVLGHVNDTPISQSSPRDMLRHVFEKKHYVSVSCFPCRHVLTLSPSCLSSKTWPAHIFVYSVRFTRKLPFSLRSELEFVRHPSCTCWPLNARPFHMLKRGCGSHATFNATFIFSRSFCACAPTERIITDACNLHCHQDVPSARHLT